MNLEKIWFTSDHHFGHVNIIKYVDRPFKDTEKMNTELIKSWNRVIGEDDTVYHLGDLTLGENFESYFLCLNGQIHILKNMWHHDSRWLKKYYSEHTLFSRLRIEGSIVVLEYPELGDGEWPQAVVLCHYPIAEWDRKHYGAWHLHGHSHGNYQTEGKILDVGVDNAYKLLREYRPFNLKEIIEIMDTK